VTNAVAELRLLHALSERGYTSNLRDAMPSEPEAISEAEQRSLTRQAARRAEARECERWEAIYARLIGCLGELDELRLPVDIAGDVQGLRHRVHKLARRVAQKR
jgi:hypothetical protein